jgi:hypothetical protein
MVDRGFIVGTLKTGKDFNLKQEIEIGPTRRRGERHNNK